MDETNDKGKNSQEDERREASQQQHHEAIIVQQQSSRQLQNQRDIDHQEKLRNQQRRNAIWQQEDCPPPPPPPPHTSHADANTPTKDTASKTTGLPPIHRRRLLSEKEHIADRSLRRIASRRSQLSQSSSRRSLCSNSSAVSEKSAISERSKQRQATRSKQRHNNTMGESFDEEEYDNDVDDDDNTQLKNGRHKEEYEVIVKPGAERVLPDIIEQASCASLRSSVTSMAPPPITDQTWLPYGQENLVSAVVVKDDDEDDSDVFENDICVQAEVVERSACRRRLPMLLCLACLLLIIINAAIAGAVVSGNSTSGNSLSSAVDEGSKDKDKDKDKDGNDKLKPTKPPKGDNSDKDKDKDDPFATPVPSITPSSAPAAPPVNNGRPTDDDDTNNNNISSISDSTNSPTPEPAGLNDLQQNNGRQPNPSIAPNSVPTEAPSANKDTTFGPFLQHTEGPFVQTSDISRSDVTANDTIAVVPENNDTAPSSVPTSTPTNTPSLRGTSTSTTTNSPTSSISKAFFQDKALFDEQNNVASHQPSASPSSFISISSGYSISPSAVPTTEEESP